MIVIPHIIMGMAFGLSFAEKEEKEVFNFKWGMTLYLGPLILVLAIAK